MIIPNIVTYILILLFNMLTDYYEISTVDQPMPQGVGGELMGWLVYMKCNPISLQFHNNRKLNPISLQFHNNWKLIVWLKGIIIPSNHWIETLIFPCTPFPMLNEINSLFEYDGNSYPLLPYCLNEINSLFEYGELVTPLTSSFFSVL